MPKAGKVALVDAETFKTVGNLDAGENPTRIELQRDERYLWVGDNAGEEGKGGVTVIDQAMFERVDGQPRSAVVLS